MTKKPTTKKLQEQVDYLTKKLISSSSERRTDNIPGQQHLFDEAEVEQDPSLLEEETVIREHTRLYLYNISLIICSISRPLIEISLI